ncbi:hypothetical protein ACJMK2_043203 [Sinanodonta woodiana]|uniref:Uncharacterized protein n=1 Tax=Sinanodonta woodiana TaxID=1069815 RepID=A0ABD3VW70_SINWO
MHLDILWDNLIIKLQSSNLQITVINGSTDLKFYQKITSRYQVVAKSAKIIKCFYCKENVHNILHSKSPVLRNTRRNPVFLTSLFQVNEIRFCCLECSLEDSSEVLIYYGHLYHPD